MASDPGKGLERQQPPPTLSANRKLTTLSVEEMQHVATGFFKSQVFKRGRDPMTMAELFVVIMMGQELGIGPGAAVSGIRMIEGRPELSANLQAAALKGSGKYDYRASWSDEAPEEHAGKYPSPYSCTVTVFTVADGQEVGSTTFSMYDADRAGLLAPSRGGHPSNYLRYPRNMLFARALSNASAFFTPDALMMRTYHTGEIEGDTDAPVPVVTDGEKVPVITTGEPYDAPDEPIDVDVEEEPDNGNAVMGAPEPDYFDPETEEPPPVVLAPEQATPWVDPAEVPEFARTPEEQALVDEWGVPLEVPGVEPTVTNSTHEKLLSPGQRGLIFVRARAADLTDERLKEILAEVTGSPHIDRVPMRLVDPVLARLKAEAQLAGD